ncbi:MAG: nitrile hydratase subunit beta [Acidimicrobiales bacterium]|nr:nitrile hydratase subunit beta [Acidimicrobiales bacterium]
MNGVHDLGGMHGFGPVAAEPEREEPVFHADWEPMVLSSMLGTTRLRQWNVDEFRRNIEQLPPVDYLRLSYYEKWLAALERLVVEHGLLTEQELATATVQGPRLDPAQIPAAWVPSFDPPSSPPAFAAGEPVRVRNRHPHAHTRVPRYARGHVGIVERHVGGEPLPEDASVGVLTVQHLYRVRFEADELWGEDAVGNDPVYLELWESYLEPVGERA